MLATRDPERARATVAELKHDADEALESTAAFSCRDERVKPGAIT
jgi:hypothetical protein